MRIKINEFCIQAIILLSTMMLTLSGVIGITTTKYCFYLIVALSFLSILYVKLTYSRTLALIVLAFSSIFVVLLHEGNVSSMLVFLSSICFLYYVFTNGITLNMWKLAKGCTYIISLALIAYAIVSPLSIYGQILMYFDNPNMAGIAVCAPAMMLVVMLCEKKKKLFRAIDLIFLLAMMYIVYQTQNRGSFLSLVLLIFLVLLPKFTKNKKRVTSPTLFALLKFTPIIVMILYVWLYEILPSSLELLGKPLFSGREGAWLSAIEKIISNPFVHYSFEEGTLNFFLEGVARYGILAMIAYFAILLTFKKSKKELKEMSLVYYAAYIAFHCCLLQQSFESTMLTGSYSIHIWSYLLFGIAVSEFSGKSNQGGV